MPKTRTLEAADYTRAAIRQQGEADAAHVTPEQEAAGRLWAAGAGEDPPTCTHPECQRGDGTDPSIIPLPCRFPAEPSRPSTTPLPTCPECLARAKYLADTDAKPLDVFDTETVERLSALHPADHRAHLYLYGPSVPLALCQCDTTLRWLEPTTNGHVRTWSALKARYGAYDCPGPEGDTWGYVGTCYPHGHTFRHRCLPPVNDRVVFHVPELPGDFAPAFAPVASYDIPGIGTVPSVSGVLHPETHHARCQNCGIRWDTEALGEIHDFWGRVSPGEPMPSGECPDCGALCQPCT